MSRIAQVMQRRRLAGEKSLIVYVTAGCPDAAMTADIVCRLAEAGADVVELGVPFSDPMADGPVIQQAATAALEKGMTMAGVLDIVRQVRQRSQVAIALMGYVNPVLQYGLESFVCDAAAAGVDGLIIPDVPFEEEAELAQASKAAAVDLIRFIAPTTTVDRVRQIVAEATGFIYLVSNTGVTGVREVEFSGLNGLVEQIRQFSTVPVAIGFGIGTAAAAQGAAAVADGVIVGSALMQRLIAGQVEEAVTFVGELRAALDGRG